MLKIISILSVIAGLAFALPQTTAYSSPVLVAAKKTAAKKIDPAVYEDQEEPDTTGLISSLYNCELGNKLTIYHNVNDDKYIALQWRSRLHRLLRVGTSTGANRFENKKNGLVWIGIPSKGILLDSKKGQQLANECKSKEQMRSVTQARSQENNS